jgi:hypothetical protein
VLRSARAIAVCFVRILLVERHPFECLKYNSNNHTILTLISKLSGILNKYGARGVRSAMRTLVSCRQVKRENDGDKLYVEVDDERRIPQPPQTSCEGTQYPRLFSCRALSICKIGVSKYNQYTSVLYSFDILLADCVGVRSPGVGPELNLQCSMETAQSVYRFSSDAADAIV